MSENSPPDTSALSAGLFLLFQDLLAGWKWLRKSRLASPAIAGTSYSEASEVRDRLREILPIVLDDSRWDTPARRDTATIEVIVAVRDYFILHSDAVCKTVAGRTYSDGFRRFVVALTDPGQPGAAMSPAELAYATGVPVDSLEDWLGSRASPGLA